MLSLNLCLVLSCQAQKMEEVSSSEMLSMLKFGSQCCFASVGAPTDEQIDAIIGSGNTLVVVVVVVL